jgi:CHRD domain
MYRLMMLGTLIAATALTSAAVAHEPSEFHATLSGFEEVGALNNQSGAILSEGRGTLDLKLDRRTQTLSFTLRFSNLTSMVTQSHIHFGKVHMAGGVMVFFCSNLPNPPPGTQPCPANGGTVTGTITAANILGIAGQNVKAEDFDALEDALESNTAYANVHTANFPAGEIRGQIRNDSRHDD